MWYKIVLVVFVLLFPVWEILWHLLGVRHVYPWQLKRIPEQKRPFILDVRTPKEYELFHLARSVNRPDMLIKDKSLPLTKDEPILVACMTGHRSPLMVKKLQRAGYTDVRNLAWGVLGWKLFRGETESGPGGRD